MASSSTSPHLRNSASILDEVAETGAGSLLLQQSEHAAGGSWDIFISHSGAQKGFAKGLNHKLHPFYDVFFDINCNSLPLAQDFPSRILHAAKTCKLALLVLSNEFLCSKWPMIELSAFVDAMPSSGVKILPLFYELSPDDLKDKAKLEEWHKRWEEFASKDSRIKVSSWAHALQRLCSKNGLVFRKSDGELAYLDEIVSAIYQMLPPLLKFSHAGIHGRDRLCKVFINKFEELEQRPSHPSPLFKVYLLGVYGLPGSGKSTLCTCLRDHFFSAFAGRALHLKLPMDPTPTQLLGIAKELLKLTDYGHNREEMMSNIVDLAQMYALLKASNLRRSRVFLVIDNISSQESLESVEAILQLGVGAGSRVMLVARTLEVLHPLLNTSKYSHGHIQYICDSMRVPSINEKEAVCVLMQPAGGVGLTSDHVIKMEEKYNSRHTGIIVKLARMCAFRTQPWPHYEHQDLLYLPLALKMIGSQLRRNGMDLEKWGRQALRFETMVKELKEDAVRKMVEESFQKLRPEKLKLVFLDVALFMVPYYDFRSIEYEAAVELLSFMHECDPDTIERQVKELKRLCFLESGSWSNEESIVVHDVFLEFAKSIADASSMYYCRRRTMAGAQVTSDLCGTVRNSNADLRAVILEVDEECERFEFPAGLSRVKAVIVRDCKSLAALGLAGLSSLVSLGVEGCPRLRCVEFDPCHACTLKCAEWKAWHACKGISDQQLQGSFLQSLLPKLQAGSAVRVKHLIKQGWHGMWAFSGHWPQRPLNGVMSLAGRLKELQVLRIEGTGITSLGDLSSYWPQLRALEVLEDHLEHLDLGNLPNLKRFFFGDAGRRCFIQHNSLRLYEEGSEPRMPKKPNLLAGCPELEDVRICKPACQDGMGTLVIQSRNLRNFWLKHIHYGEPVLPDFTSSAHSLEELGVFDHWVLHSIEFTHQFRGLVQLHLWGCPNLVKITGLECLPNLRDLNISSCAKLQSLGNLEGVRMLEGLQLGDCPALILTSQGLSSLEFLATIFVSQDVQFSWSDFENLTALRRIDCNVHVSMFKLQNLVNLEHLSLKVPEICEAQATHELSLCGFLNGEVDCRHVNNINAQVPLFVVGESAPTRLSSLALYCVRNLVCLDGIHHLRMLRWLTLADLPQLTFLQEIHHLRMLEFLKLEYLPQLTCLQGLESLVNLRLLCIRHCMAVNELPSLCTLVNMESLFIGHCVNLKAVEGCDEMGLLEIAWFDGCENLENCPAPVERLSQSGRLQSLRFKGCKFASIKAMVGWVLDEKIRKVMFEASLDALAWELTDRLLEKRKERMELGEQLVETLGLYFTKKQPALNDDEFFDSRPWVDVLERRWRHVCRDLAGQWKGKAAPRFPREMQRLLEGLGRVPAKSVLQKCQSDARFRTSLANCLLEMDHRVLDDWLNWLIPRFMSQLV